MHMTQLCSSSTPASSYGLWHYVLSCSCFFCCTEYIWLYKVQIIFLHPYISVNSLTAWRDFKTTLQTPHHVGTISFITSMTRHFVLVAIGCDYYLTAISKCACLASCITSMTEHFCAGCITLPTSWLILLS